MIQREQVALSNSKAHLSCLPSPPQKGGGTTSVQAPRETLLRAKGNHFPGGRASGVLPDSISTLLRPQKRAKDPDCSSERYFLLPQTHDGSSLPSGEAQTPRLCHPVPLRPLSRLISVLSLLPSAFYLPGPPKNLLSLISIFGGLCAGHS